MIPKIIHYCWFGGNPKNELAKKCIASWEKKCPGWEIREWNETNFDIQQYDFTKEAYQMQKWAFITDLVRILIIQKYGGIYLDTDVEILKPFDELLKYDCFLGFQDKRYISLGLGFGAEKQHPLIDNMVNLYTNKHFINQDGSLNDVPITVTLEPAFREWGFLLNNQLQVVKNVIVLPSQYLSPIDCETLVKNVTPMSFSIHYYAGSWVPKEFMMELKLKKYSKRIKNNVIRKGMLNLITVIFKIARRIQERIKK